MGKGANNDWLDVRPDGNATAGEILVPNDLVEAVSHLYSSNRVKVEWEKAEGATHPTATAVQNLRPAENQGTVTGKVVAKDGERFEWIEIKQAEGPLAPLSFPAGSGGLRTKAADSTKSPSDLIREAEVGSDVNATWEYDERIRLVSLIKLGGEQPNPQPEPETGAIEGILVGKGANNDWLDVRPDGNATAGEILVPNDLVEAVSHLYSSNRVKVEWEKAEGATHPTATAVQNLRPAENQGTVTGKVVDKFDDNSWIEIKPAEGPLRRYQPRWIGGNTGAARPSRRQTFIRETEIGSDVNATWVYDERIRIGHP